MSTRASTDPMLSGSVDELERATERFLSGFGELRTLQTTITRTYEDQILAPAKDMAGLYSIIEGATGRREARIWPALGKSRETFTATLVAANAYYLAPALTSADEVRKNTDAIERTIPVMIDFSDNDLQRDALQRLKARTSALHDGIAKPVRIARQADGPAAQLHRRQPGGDHRRDRRSVGQDAAARAERANDFRPHARGHLPHDAVDRRDLPRRSSSSRASSSRSASACRCGRS